MAGLRVLRSRAPAADGHSYGYPYAQRRCRRHRDAFGASGPHSGSDAHSPGDSHCDAQPLADDFPHTCGDGDSQPHPYGDPHSHTHADTNAYAYSHSVADTRPWAGWRTGLGDLSGPGRGRGPGERLRSVS